jgi:capsular polysaccharide biosynthesis protein
MQLILSLITAGLLSIGLAFVAEYVDPSFRTPKDVEESLDIPLLAAIPKNGH